MERVAEISDPMSHRGVRLILQLLIQFLVETGNPLSQQLDLKILEKILSLSYGEGRRNFRPNEGIPCLNNWS